MDREFKGLVHESTLEPVEYSDWAAPIVAVLKQDGEHVHYVEVLNKL